uniref:Uncharacterized protein n=1 Tax=Arundo donax TaxID=35708 RepID=A0A0A8Y6G7_ARUDO
MMKQEADGSNLMRRTGGQKRSRNVEVAVCCYLFGGYGTMTEVTKDS